MSRVTLLLAAFAVLALALPAAAEPDRVRFPGPGVTLAGFLYRPAGHGPFPALVALHGCGGLVGRDGKPGRREDDWAHRLSAEGFIVLLPDSFSPRGLGSQCRNEDRKVRASRERVDDAHAARRWLQQHDFVKADAVSLMGWSNGGGATLYAVRANGRPIGAGPDFSRAVAFYPGCRMLAEQKTWRPRMPVLILVGEADDWTPPAACRALSEMAGPDVTFHAYPGAYHDFDDPDRPVRRLRGLAFTAGGAGEAFAGTDPSARADALRRVPAFLAR